MIKKNSIYFSLVFLFFSCAQTAKEIELSAEAIDTNQSEVITSDSIADLFTTSIDSLDIKAFEARDTENSENTFSQSQLSDTNGRGDIGIGQYLLYSKNETTKKLDFKGKLMTEIKGEFETSIFYIYFENNGLVPWTKIGDVRKKPLEEGQTEYYDWLVFTQCLDGRHKVFQAFDHEQKVQCIAVLNLDYEAYFTSHDIVKQIEDAIKISTDSK